MSTFRSLPTKLSDQAMYDKNNLPQRVQLLRAGTFFHKGQEVTVSPVDLEKMVFNFNEKVRGIDLMIDYGHNSEGEAAAWITNLYLSENNTELWAEVSWTASGEDAVLTKKYRYLSADFMFNYKNNENLSEHGPTLFGAGLTNRPVVKNMAPVIQLSEQKGEYKMEELQKQIDALKAMIEEMKGQFKKPEEVEVEMAAQKAEMEKKEMELAEKEKCLSEKQSKMEKEASFNKLFSEGKVVEAQREPFIEGDVVKFSELAVTTNQKNAGNNGGENNNTDKRSAEDKVLELAEKLMESEKITFSESVKRVLAENKDLEKEYNQKFQE